MPAEPSPAIGTKIIATLGPASNDEAMVRRLVQAGVGVFRLNFSHGTLEEHGAALGHVRTAADELGQPVAVMGDLAGPKIRLGEVADERGEGGMSVEPGRMLIIQRDPIIGAALRVSTNYERFVDEVAVGHRVLIDDGRVRLLVTDKLGDEVVCRCTAGGLLSTAKGVNLPDTDLTLGALTDHDRRCARWALEHELDWLALSFVRRPEDLAALRDLVDDRLPLIAKIEKPEAVGRIDAIIDGADAIMVARGDLGVEMDVARVPLIQKDLVWRCGRAGKPVIVATQMLQSMIDAASPTRAEVSDVANAIIDGADAIMLSGETAIGRYPVLTVRAMARIADQTERYLRQVHPPEDRPMPKLALREQDAALARGAWQMAHHLDVRIVVVWSQSGAMARIFSKLRLGVPVVALSGERRAVRRMGLYFGIRPVHMEVPQSIVELTRRIEKLLIERELARAGETVLIVGGTGLGRPGRSNAVVVHRLGEPE